MSEAEPRVNGATLDAPCRVTLRLNRRVWVGEWPASRFTLKTSQGLEVPIKSVEPVALRNDQTTTFSLETAEPLDFIHNLYEVWVAGAGSRLVSVRDVLLDRDRYFEQAVLGYTYTCEHTTFRVFAPTAAGVQVIIADEVKGDRGLIAQEMTRKVTGVWEASVPGNHDCKYYAYRLTGIGFNPLDEVGDVYAACAQGLSPRTLIVDMAKTDPPGFREQRYTNPPSPVDAVVYEMHVRDFSIARNSGVKTPGKFLGVAEAGTRLQGDASISTGLDHLAELGVTHVQLMPVSDFDNHEDRNDEYHWGYMPVYFSSPEGWYATEFIGPARVRELKAAIHALHERGIGVIMDVVYNHTAKVSPFERLVPHYYYRKTPSDRFSNGSGCGNEFMSEAPMARKFMIDSLKMWVQEYRVDGFRFDLMGLHDLETMKQIKAELSAIRPDIFLWGEPWTGGSTPLKPVTGKEQVRGTGIACFNDAFRDAIKGDRDGGSPGFVQTGDRKEIVRLGLEGAIHDWAIGPAECVNYFECHDNLTTWDKLLQSCPEANEAYLEQLARFAAMLLFTAQGAAFMQAGQEFGRSKRGHCNTYNLPDAVNQIDWSLKKRRATLCEYYRGLIALRKAHPAFRLKTREEVESRVWFGDTPHERSMAHIIHSADLKDETAQAIVMLYNAHHDNLDFPLGDGVWSIHADARQAGLEPLGTVQHRVTVPSHSGMILIR
jgi:pullulanase